MRVLVAQRRAVIIVLGTFCLCGLILGCAQRGATPDGAGGPPQMDELTRTAQEGMAPDAVFTEAATVAAETVAAETVAAESDAIPSRMLSAAGPGQLGLEMIEGPTFNRVVITADAADPGYRVSRLETPARLVVDLPNQPSRLNRIFDTQDAEFISSVRLGAHSDKSRIVLDLATYPDLAHHVTVDGNALVVTVAREADIEVALNTVIPTAVVAEVAVDEAMVVDNTARARQPEGAFTAQGAGAHDPAAAPASSESEITAADSAADSAESLELRLDAGAKNSEENSAELTDAPRLTNVAIESVGTGENILVATMEAAGFYTLHRSAPSEYVLTLEQAEAAPTAQQTILAPPGGGEIRSVRTIREGKDLLLRIFADPASTLEARSSGGKIIVSSVGKPLIGDAADTRAQFDPNAKTGGENNQSGEAAAPSTGGGNSNSAAASSGTANGAPSEGDIAALFEDTPKYTGRLISLDLQDTDIDNALRIIAEVSNLNIIASDDVTGKVTLRLIDVPWDQALDVILKTNGLDKVQEGNVVRIAPVEKLRQEREVLKQAQQAEEELEPLQVRYVRVSYAKAAELQPLVEGVLSERGSVSYDERTNQLIIKDIGRGIKNVAVLVSKVDLRTPQVLLETQIVEANRDFSRDLGTELGFEFIQSPATGNATGHNFPNAIAASGSVLPGQNVGSSFPAAISGTAGSAVSFLLDSADGTQSLDTRITALEREGRARVVSRPSVATTNNTQATIKSVEKIRVKTPSGGLSVATGSGASAAGTSAIATEIIEIGIILEVTPQASPDYYVLLDIDAKSSTLGTTVVEGIPSEIERSATSTVLVSSGQTFALGGIYKINDRNTVDGVPFLKDIPFLGHLFRRTFVDNRDEELIFFITPRIIEGSFDDATMRASS